MKVDIVPDKRRQYGVKNGEPKNMPRAHAKVLVAIGHATYATDKPKASTAKRTYRRRDMVAESAVPAIDVMTLPTVGAAIYSLLPEPVAHEEPASASAAQEGDQS